MPSFSKTNLYDGKNGLPEFLTGLPITKITIDVKTPEGEYLKYYKTTPRGGTLSVKTLKLLFDHIKHKHGIYPDLCSTLQEITGVNDE
jgi:hypothetical protein